MICVTCGTNASPFCSLEVILTLKVPGLFICLLSASLRTSFLLSWVLLSCSQRKDRIYFIAYGMGKVYIRLGSFYWSCPFTRGRVCFISQRAENCGQQNLPPAILQGCLLGSIWWFLRHWLDFLFCLTRFSPSFSLCACFLSLSWRGLFSVHVYPRCLSLYVLISYKDTSQIGLQPTQKASFWLNHPVKDPTSNIVTF